MIEKTNQFYYRDSLTTPVKGDKGDPGVGISSVTVQMVAPDAEPSAVFNSDTGTLALRLPTQMRFPTIAEGVPGSIPEYVGLIYFDKVGNGLYMSIGTSSASDWVQLNADGPVMVPNKTTGKSVPIHIIQDDPADPNTRQIEMEDDV